MVERNESVYIWHDVDGRAPYFEAPDIFAGFNDASSVADYYPQQRLYRERLEMHPQYVLENGVDFAHFKYVHNTPIVPIFTRHDFAEPVSFVDFTITFEGDDNQKIEDIDSRVEAINGGLGIAVTKSWGMIDNRTISAITPVDESTSDVRFMVYIGRTPGKDSERAETKAREFGQEVIRQFEQDVEIWRHQRYSDPPALATAEYEGSPQFASGPSSSIPTASVAAPPTSTPHPRKAEPNECTDSRVPSCHRQRRFGDDQADRRTARSGTHWRALLLAGQDRQGHR